MPFSLRLDPETEGRIRRLSSATGRSRAFVVREAVARYAAALENGDGAAESAYDRLKAVIGAVRTGGANYSTDTHAQYRRALRRKHRAKRSR